MKINRLARAFLHAAFTAVFCAAGTAAAQDYPNRPIRLVVPFPPGGATDILGRLLADRLGAAYKQSVVVENRPGASGHVGAQQVAKAAGDGYTLLAGTIGIHAAYSSYRKLGYDPAAELQPIMVLGESPNIVTVPVASPYKTFGDFLADAKANPGKINYASAGPGSSIHMVTALFEITSGARLTHVPANVIEKLNRDAQRAFAEPEVAARLAALGMNYTPNTPAQAAAFVKAETAKWNRVIDAANIRLD